MKRILMIQGHPNKESFCFALEAEYIKGAQEAGAEIKRIVIADLQFNPSLQGGYRQRTELEPDLIDAQKLILWAEHIVILHPVWWASYPAILKGFLDRVLLPGFGFKYIENSIWWEKLLKGRTGRIIYTMDTPKWYWWFKGKPAVTSLKDATLEFCGIAPVKTTGFSILKSSDETKRKQWLSKAYKLGVAMK